LQKIRRMLNIDLPQGQSAFLWGPRKTGKSTYLKEMFPQSLLYDFLKTDLVLEFTKRPSLLREQILAKDAAFLEHPVILDEVQKVPQMLNEVHWLIENKGLSFILCGSSARKLKRGKANLLGGRAFEHFIFTEIVAHSSYGELDYRINYWRTRAGYEVDFILGEREVAIEVKGQSSVDNRDLRPLKAFMEEYATKKALVVCNDKEERVLGKIRVMPWRRFLEELWEGKIIS